MAKVKRSVLKQLIKECLVEILIEGIDSESGINALVEAARPRPSSRKNPEMERIQENRKLLDSKRAVPKAIGDDVINTVTSDPIMADILRDTASTTLMSQGLSNSPNSQARHSPVDAAAATVANNDLERLFEGSQNWAQLAFDNSGKK